MVTTLDIVIELSDLFEATGYEKSQIAELFDTEILPMLKTPLSETDIGGLGVRFATVIDKVRSAVQGTGEKIKTLKDMMKSALLTYAKNTNDIMTARAVYHRAIMSGGDTMLTVTGGTILANALAKQHGEQAKNLLRGISQKLSGAQPVEENASGGAVSAGAIATVATPGKTRKNRDKPKDSIFLENSTEHIYTESLTLNDLLGIPETMKVLREVAETGCGRQHNGVMVDPTTAELVLSVHSSLKPKKRQEYEAKSYTEMVDIAYRAVQRGLIEVSMEEG